MVCLIVFVGWLRVCWSRKSWVVVVEGKKVFGMRCCSLGFCGWELWVMVCEVSKSEVKWKKVLVVIESGMGGWMEIEFCVVFVFRFWFWLGFCFGGCGERE